MVDWPTELPQELDQQGYSETPAKLTIRSQTESGIPKKRRRFSSGVKPITGQMILTYAETLIFDDFYENDLASGALNFDWVHPRTGAACTFGFVSEPQITAVGAAFQLSMQLEIMP